MPRTPILKKYVNKLIAINDQLCFYLFLKEQLKKELLNFSSNVEDILTTDLFTNNIYSKKINVKIKDLPKFQNVNESLIFGSSFSTSYEFFADYLETSLNIFAEINNIRIPNINENKIEELYFKKLEKAKITLPDIEIKKTIYYLRCRRNHFIHMNEGIDSKLKDFIQSEGQILNTYWGSKNMTFQKLSFEEIQIDMFEEAVTIDMIKLLRVMLELLDDNIVKFIDRNKLIKYFILNHRLKKSDENSLKMNEKVKKYLKMIKMEYTIDVNNDEVKLILESLVYSLNLMLAKSEVEKQGFIDDFKMEFVSKKDKYNVLIINIENRWILAFFSDKREFKEALLGLEDELVNELKKPELDRDSKKIYDLLSVRTGHNHR